MSKPKPRREMDADEKAAMDCLKQCTFSCGSWDKRFERHLSSMEYTVTEKEVPQLWRILYRYRRQWRHGKKPYLLSKASRLSAPDYRQQQAAEHAKSEIERRKALLGTEYVSATQPLTKD